MRLAALAIAGLLALVPLAARPALAAAPVHDCGDVPGPPDAPQNVRAKNVGCTAALRLARRHSHRVAQGQTCDLRKPSCTLDAYKCRRRFFGNSGTRVTCTRGTRVVRFFYGV